jgi:putative addiction module killer protein
MEAQSREIEIYRAVDGKEPYRDWVLSLTADIRARLSIRLKRVQDGNFGDHHEVGKGVWELIFDFGPGYRVYYGLAGKKLVLLLHGGQKKRQSRDVALAYQYWEDYKANN